MDDPRNGTTQLQATIDLSRAANLPYVQFISFNGYGEGTMLEPTVEFQYTFPETIQKFAGVSCSVAELKLICKWYTMRKKYRGNAAVQAPLTQAHYYLVSLRVDKATALLATIN